MSKQERISALKDVIKYFTTFFASKNFSYFPPLKPRCVLESEKYGISKGLNLNPLLDATLIWSIAIQKAWSHFKCVSWHIFSRVSFIMGFIFSVFPVDWGFQDARNFHRIFSACPTFREMSKVNHGPLALWVLWRGPNLGIISLSNSFATLVAFSVLVGYTSIHPVKVSTKTNKNLKFPLVLGHLTVLKWTQPVILYSLFRWGTLC